MAGFRLGKALGLEVSASPQRKTQQQTLTSMQARQPAYKTIQQRGTGVVNQFLPQQVQAGQDLADYYKAGPDEGGMNASNATALRTVDSGYAAAGARLKALGARTGADTTGAVATLEGNRATSAMPIQQNIAARRQAEIERFKRGAVATTGQLAGQGSGMEMQGLQGGQSLDNQIFNTAGSIAAAEEARKAANQQRLQSFIQQAAQVAGGASGGGGRVAPATPTGLGADGSTVQFSDGTVSVPYGQRGSDGYDYSFYPGGY